jgi:tRNA(Ile)-lysidine synthase
MNQNIIPKKNTIIVGFSGGPDSVYLLEKLLDIQITEDLTIIAAHLDHEWRTDSSKDVVWCKNYCEQKNIKFITKKISELAIDDPKTGSKEASARIYRQFFLESLAQQHPNSLIALGHHRDDQIETFFIRLARGTTAAGLGCMKPQDGIYIRPLLEISKEEILSFLEKKKIDFLTDPTNQDTAMLRNHIRAKLIPQLQDIDSRFINNIEKTIFHLQDSYDAFKSVAEKMISEITEDNCILTKQFLTFPDSVKDEALSKILIKQQCQITQSNRLFKEIIRFLEHGTQKKHLVHPSCEIIKIKDRFTISNPLLTEL